MMISMPNYASHAARIVDSVIDGPWNGNYSFCARYKINLRVIDKNIVFIMIFV